MGVLCSMPACMSRKSQVGFRGLAVGFELLFTGVVDWRSANPTLSPTQSRTPTAEARSPEESPTEGEIP